MDKKHKMKGRLLLTIEWMLLAVFCFSMQAFAQGAEIKFGTQEGYTWKNNERSPLGFYLVDEAGESFTDVKLVVSYDPEVLRFEGASDSEVTVISDHEFEISGTGTYSGQFKKILRFTPLLSENTTVTIQSGTAKKGDETISSESPVSTGVTIPLEAKCGLAGLSVAGNPVEGFDTSVLRYAVSVPYEVETAGIVAEGEVGATVSVADETLAVGTNVIPIIVKGGSGFSTRYTVVVNRQEAPVQETTEESVEEVPSQSEEIEASSEETMSDFLDFPDLSGSEESEPVEETEPTEKAGMPVGVKILLIVLGVLVALLVISLLVVFYSRRAKENLPAAAPAEKTLRRKRKKQDVGGVVIRAEDVCMDFDRQVNEYSSIKEFLIRKIKGELKPEKYRALDHISFDITKGEVIGVIGTNGAGKSTLLKIISGALRPTEGRMLVNKKKVQILTLGTGFDMELTGKENVYLNGAIIGYEREFIDEHYNEIVEFAELEDFMNEKVKNYSSGMVSRLGFAIATVRNTPEILILDEVLSVGDRIFQQKSLQKVKEMIQSESTVIMVSHSTKSIRENCNRAIWIEKGHMILQGDASKVCALYEKYDGNLEKLLEVREILASLIK